MDIELKQYAKRSRLPLKALRWMVREGLIQDPLTGHDLVGLALLERVWGRQELLRIQFKKMSQKKRKEFLEKIDLETRWERYAFARFRNLPRGKKLPMKRLIGEIEMTFDLRLDHWQIQRLYRVRQKIYHLRMKEKTSSKCGNK